jgi:hypothetical protein
MTAHGAAVRFRQWRRFAEVREVNGTSRRRRSRSADAT